jgi:hypothetical protein
LEKYFYSDAGVSFFDNRDAIWRRGGTSPCAGAQDPETKFIIGMPGLLPQQLFPQSVTYWKQAVHFPPIPVRLPGQALYSCLAGV